MSYNTKVTLGCLGLIFVIHEAISLGNMQLRRHLQQQPQSYVPLPSIPPLEPKLPPVPAPTIPPIQPPVTDDGGLDPLEYQQEQAQYNAEAAQGYSRHDY